MVNPKTVQQAFNVAVALANPVLDDKDWTMLKTRFQLEDHVLAGIKALINVTEKNKDAKLVLTCLSYSV